MDIISYAMEVANKSANKYKHNAVLVKNNKIIATGYNKYVQTCYATKCITIHAEIDAISNCNPSILPECILYVVRVNSNNELTYSKPCLRCQRYIIRKKIKTTYYS